MATLDTLIDELQSDGAVESEGRFTLDREQARAKMQKFQLADARRYVLELVQSAVLRGAQAIAFEIDADDMRMRFDGEVFTEAEVDDLYGSLFRDGSSPALEGVRQLALALNAALGLDPKYIHVRSGFIELRMRPGASDEITVLERFLEGTQIHVKQRVRPRLLVDFVLNLTGRLGEEQHLRERCCYASATVTLDGKLISRGLEAGEGARASITYGGADYRGFIELRRRQPTTATTVHLVKNGVWIDSRQPPGCGTYLVAVVEGDHLRKDASQATIVNDAALSQVLAATRSVRWRLWHEALREAVGEDVALVWSQVVEQLLEGTTRAELAADPDAMALAERLRRPDCRDPSREVSMRELIERAEAGETLRWAREAYPTVAVEDPPIILLDPAEVERFATALSADLIEADTLLARARLRERGRREWLEREGEPVLPTYVQALARGPLIGHAGELALRGEVAIDRALVSTYHEHPARVLLFKQGRLLGRLELDLGVPNLWLVIDAELDPTDDYRDVVRNRSFAKALLRALAALAGPMRAALSEVRGRTHESSVRGLAKRWLIALVDPKTRAALLGSAGVDGDPGQSMGPAQLLPELLDLGGPAAAEQPEATDEPALLVDQPLFRDARGQAISLRAMAATLEAEGALGFVAGAPSDARLQVAGVPVLGPGDRKIVRALFGEDTLRPHDIEPLARRLRHQDRAPWDLAKVVSELASVGLDAQWRVELDGSSRGLMVAAYGEHGFALDELDAETLATTSLQVFVDQREFAVVDVELGFGPLLLMIEDPRLRPDARFENLVEDAGYVACLAELRAHADRLWRQLVERYADAPLAARRWLARVLLHGAAAGGDPRRADALRELAWIDTVQGDKISIADVEAIARARGQVEVVDRSVGWARVAAPKLLRIEEDELDQLRVLVPAEYVDGSSRIRHQRAASALEALPIMIGATLDPDAVFGAVELRAEDRVGVVGLSRIAREPGLSLRLGVAGRLVHTASGPSAGVWLPLEAAVIDERLALDERGVPDMAGKYYRGLLKQIRKTAARLIIELCERWPVMSEAEQRDAWRISCVHIEHEARAQRSSLRDQAFEQVQAIPGFRDLWGRRYSLEQLREAGARGSLKALANRRPTPPELPARPLILALDEHERSCLVAGVELEVELLDDRWEAELAWLQTLDRAALIERPDPEAVALAHRKAQAAGGLECELWIPRDYSPLAPVGAPPSVAIELDGLAVAELRLLDMCPCAGILSGPGLELSRGELVLDARERSSLIRQILIMYLELGERVAKLSADDHARALEYMAWIDFCAGGGATELEHLSSDRKRAHALLLRASELTPPTLRESLRWREPEPAPQPEVAPELEAVSEPAGHPPKEPTTGTGTGTASAPASRSANSAPPVQTPRARLLTAVYEQLHWARARHQRLLHELRLAQLELDYFDESGRITELRVSGIALNQGHPIIARLLGQDPFDMVDLSFVVAAVYTLMNELAEEISDDHEREFVNQLAESLALSLKL